MGHIYTSLKHVCWFLARQQQQQLQLLIHSGCEVVSLSGMGVTGITPEKTMHTSESMDVDVAFAAMVLAERVRRGVIGNQRAVKYQLAPSDCALWRFIQPTITRRSR